MFIDLPISVTKIEKLGYLNRKMETQSRKYQPSADSATSSKSSQILKIKNTTYLSIDICLKKTNMLLYLNPDNGISSNYVISNQAHFLNSL